MVQIKTAIEKNGFFYVLSSVAAMLHPSSWVLKTQGNIEPLQKQHEYFESAELHSNEI